MNSMEAYLYSLIKNIETSGEGKPGKDGITPHIGENGNWFIGEQDTGVQSQGQPPTDEQIKEVIDEYIKTFSIYWQEIK